MELKQLTRIQLKHYESTNVPKSDTYLAGILSTLPKASADHVCSELRVGTLTFFLSHNWDTHFLKDVSGGT